MTTRLVRRLRQLPVPFILLLLPSPVRTQQVAPTLGPVVQGVVTDRDSGIPLGTGSVALYGGDGSELLTVFTDDQGRYSLRAPASGAYRLRAERVGYHPQEQGPFSLQATDTLTVDFRLSPAPLLMDSILVTVQRRAQPLRPGEQFVYGRLLDDESGEPIPQGLLRLLSEAEGSAAATLSDDEGLFWLVSPAAGVYRLQAERIGYRTSTGPELYLMPGDTIGLDFYLSMEAILLNPLVVRATARPLENRYDLTGMSGFLERYSRFSKVGFGEFLTRDSLAKYEEWSLGTGQMMSLTMMSVWEANPMTEQVALRGGCRPAYFLEGSPLPPGFPIWSLTPDLLEAVEVYVRPNIPAEFLRGGWPCGVVSYWYRRAPDPRAPVPAWRKVLMGAGILGLALLLII